MWRVGVFLLVTLGAAVAFDRRVAQERLAGYRIESQNIHIDHLEHEMEELEDHFHKLSSPITEGDKWVAKARLARNEGRKCTDREVSCGGDIPQCINNLLMCDGRKDCENGNDEHEWRCSMEPVRVGRAYSGVLHWSSCMQRDQHPTTVVITAAYRAPFFKSRAFVQATITSLVRHRRGSQPVTIVDQLRGYFVFASQQLVLFGMKDGTNPNMGVLCNFHFGDHDHTYCEVQWTASRHKCAEALLAHN